MTRSKLRSTAHVNATATAGADRGATSAPEAPEIGVIDYMTNEVKALANEMSMLTDWVDTWADRSIGFRPTELKQGKDQADISVTRSRVDELRRQIQDAYALFHKLQVATYRINEL